MTNDTTNRVPPVPYIVYEGEMARQERTIKRLWVLCLVMFLSLVASNCAWLYYESQFTDQVITQEADSGDGGTAVISGTGDIIYGTSEADR